MIPLIEIIAEGAKAVFKFLTDRVVWMVAITTVLFALLFAHLFNLQIVRYGEFVAAPPVTTTVRQTLAAPRGNIYDRFGRPLTVNNTAYIVVIDPTHAITNPNINEAMYQLTRLFERNGENFADEFPMTREWPYEFTIRLGAPEETRLAWEYRWKDDMAIPDPRNATAVESFEYLRDWFNIDPELSNEDARRILNFRTQIFRQRFMRDNPRIEVATDISHATVVAIEERSDLFVGVSIERMTLRSYPQGLYFAHLLGYTGRVNAEQFATFQHLGITDYDHIGHTALERAMEPFLRGQNGLQVVEVNPSTGRRVNDQFVEFTPPIPGNDVFLTIDIEMQIRTYYIVKEHLTTIAIGKIRGQGNERAVPPQRIAFNLVRGGWLPVRDVMEAELGGDAYRLRQYVLDRFPEATPRDQIQVHSLLLEGVNSGRISPNDVLLAMVDLGILSDYNDFSARVRVANARTLPELFVEKLEMWELTPQMVNIDPATAQVTVVCTHTGAVLAAVSYPSFDNNMLANFIDAEYYFRVNTLDPTTPLVNRPFMEPRAPGSTFKMFTAAAGLEHGVITPRSTITDRVRFTRAGNPPAHCWSPSGHGAINVMQAIAVSCNYFFYETAMRLGSNRFERIDNLNRYMAFFGLNSPTGVEIGEFATTFPEGQDVMASPAFKEFNARQRNEFALPSDWEWRDGDTIRVAIGQGQNNLTSATMARAMAQIANRGDRYPLHLVSHIVNHQDEIVVQAERVPDQLDMELSESTWDALHDGMLRTTRSGTASRNFSGFPIAVGGKTGTAEQVVGRPAHQSFGGFAPFYDPQIALFVTVPFGTTQLMPGSATVIGREVFRAFLVPEVNIEHPQQVNTMRR